MEDWKNMTERERDQFRASIVKDMMKAEHAEEEDAVVVTTTDDEVPELIYPKREEPVHKLGISEDVRQRLRKKHTTIDSFDDAILNGVGDDDDDEGMNGLPVLSDKWNPERAAEWMRIVTGSVIGRAKEDMPPYKSQVTVATHLPSGTLEKEYQLKEEFKSLSKKIEEEVKDEFKTKETTTTTTTTGIVVTNGGVSRTTLKRRLLEKHISKAGRKLLKFVAERRIAYPIPIKHDDILKDFCQYWVDREIICTTIASPCDKIGIYATVVNMTW